MEFIDKNPLISEKHKQYRAEIRAFAESEIKAIARKLDRENRFSNELTKKMGKKGLLGIQIPQKYGGQGLDTLSYIIAVEELARVDGSQAATVAAHNSLGLYPIYKYGTEEQRQHYLPRLSSGEHLWAFGLTEPTAGSDAQGVKTRAELQGDKWLINGSKIFITNSASEMAAGVTIQAVTGEKDGKAELSAILVDRDTKGFTRSFITGKLVWRSADTGRLFFQNSVVSKDKLLGKKGEGAHIMLETLDGGRLSIAAMGLGLAQGAYEMAKEYALNRQQFGKPIAKFQSVAFKLADMDMKIELARNTLYNACWLKDNGNPLVARLPLQNSIVPKWPNRLPTRLFRYMERTV
jgi:short-chain 2-methylacyl-CoA dehydrogenase